jgi:hypothetical protein
MRGGPDIGGSGTLEGAKIITKADNGREGSRRFAAGLCPLARAWSQLLPAAFAAFTKINDLYQSSH